MSGNSNQGGPENGWTRGQLLRRAGAGLVLAGSGGRLLSGLADPPDAAAAPLAASPPSVRYFHSRPDLLPPAIEVVQQARGTAAGYLFLTPYAGPGQRGVLIVDNTGEVVWFHPTTPLTAINVRAAVYRGRPVLTWWEGKSAQGIGQGHCVIVDESYRVVARFDAGGGMPADLHEFIITAENTALVSANEVRRMDLTSYGATGSHPVVGGVVREIDISTGKVMFDWHSIDHVGLDESHQKVGPAFDYFHINSIARDSDGHLIVSARNTWAIYKIHRRTGAVIWRLGGKKSDFAMPPGARFAWQHDARPHENGKLLSLFDDGASPKVEARSRALLFQLDTDRRRAALVRQFVHTSLLATHTGSAQLLPNGNMLVGWGSEPYFTEFAANGAVRFDAKLPVKGETYRALRFPWVGRPGLRPSVAPGPNRHAVFASWNGATEVASWQLRVGKKASSLRIASTRPRTGFETLLELPGGSTHVQVVALDSKGAPLGRSATTRV